jgi:hypothetical protein
VFHPKGKLKRGEDRSRARCARSRRRPGTRPSPDPSCRPCGIRAVSGQRPPPTGALLGGRGDSGPLHPERRGGPHPVALPHRGPQPPDPAPRPRPRGRPRPAIRTHVAEGRMPRGARGGHGTDTARKQRMLKRAPKVLTAPGHGDLSLPQAARRAPHRAAAWPAASVLAWLRARRAGPRQPQVQRAVQKRPCSVVVVRCSCPCRARSGPSCCATVTTLQTPRSTICMSIPALGSA